MKKTLALFLILCAQLALAQEPRSGQKAIQDDPVYDPAGLDIKPEFPGGLQAFYKFVENHFAVPNVPKLKGKIIVMFVIEKDGSLSDIKVLRDIGHGTGAEALRVLGLSPKWNPGQAKGQIVRTLYSLPISIPSIPQPGKTIQEIKDK